MGSVKKYTPQVGDVCEFKMDNCAIKTFEVMVGCHIGFVNIFHGNQTFYQCFSVDDVKNKCINYWMAKASELKLIYRP